MLVYENYNLRNHNSFGFSASAKFFCEISNVEEFYELSEQLKEGTFLVLGEGSNILFSKAFDGCVVRFTKKGITIVNEDKDSVMVEVFAGENWDNFVAFAVEHKYYGIENLSLIPGSVGAAPVQNIGAYGQELQDTFFAVNGVALDSGETKTFFKSSCYFGYRSSIFKEELKNKFLITSVVFRLKKNHSLTTRYGSIEEELKAQGISNPDLSDLRNTIIKIRQEKLPNPRVLGNCGSFFKNPEVDPQVYEKLKTEYPSLKSFPATYNKVKIPAGWLIEECGWKGKKMGNVGVHAQQALVLVNYGGGTANELLELAKNIKADVLNRFDILLEEEVNIV